ncbi:MAG: type VI secretion system tip protein VgrG [Pseudomonadales bacterium]|nr:type VI secretion system tip protein VgrG [Pseudomonadales bacterium]
MSRLHATQANRSIAVKTPLDDDVLLFHRMTATEELGRLFQFNLDLLSTNPKIEFHKILGQSMTVRYQRQDKEIRHFNGIVSQFSQAGSHGDLYIYRATLSPWFWLLTRTTDSRIFQNKTVPDIIKDIFREHGFNDVEESLTGTYREWENCVQYRETDFNFISRLLEQEGIYYYFKHEEDKHTLVLADSANAHEAIPGYEKVPFFPPEGSERRERDHLYKWTLNQNIQSGIYTLNDFDFKKPKANLLVNSTFPREHDLANYEVYDYPGEYRESGEGENYARTRIEELQVQYEHVQAKGNAAGLVAGCLFTLTNYFSREDQNREYLITVERCHLGPQEYESRFDREGGTTFSTTITAIDSQQPFRARRSTPKPIVQGPQTAIVVGKEGEEIWTDKYGRVKVRFHWDRFGESNENSSCWMRVSHPWAGKNWGAVAIPRIGQEVIVSFLEGDPDQPIITGRVYNDDNMPPYDLPANATQSGIKTRSSKGGTSGNFNELRFEDKKGAEEVYIHAEKDYNSHVENDYNIEIEHDASQTVINNAIIDIGVNHTEAIGGDMHLAVTGSQDTEVTGNRDIAVTGDSTNTITGSHTQTVTGNVDTWIHTDESKKVIGNTSEIFIGTKKELQVGAKTSNFVGAVHETLIGAKVVFNLSTEIETTKGVKCSISEAKSVHKTKLDKYIAENLWEVTCPDIQMLGKDQIYLKVGGTHLKITSSGVEIKGNVTIKGDLKVTGKFNDPGTASNN